MKISDQKLDELLILKQQQTCDVVENEEEVIRIFQNNIRKTKSRPRFYWAIAASIALCIGVLSIMMWQMKPQEIDLSMAKTSSWKIYTEVSKLFGDESALAVIEDQVLIGERYDTKLPLQNVSLKIINPATGQAESMILRVAENDTLTFSGEISGEILISRSDNSTLVADIDLKSNDKHIKQIVVIKTA